MSNSHKIPPAHPMIIVSYVVMAAGLLLFISNFFLGPNIDQPHEKLHDFRRA